MVLLLVEKQCYHANGCYWTNYVTMVEWIPDQPLETPLSTHQTRQTKSHNDMGLAVRIISHTHLPEKAVKAVKEKLQNWSCETSQGESQVAAVKILSKKIPRSTKNSLIEWHVRSLHKASHQYLKYHRIWSILWSLHHKGKGFHKEAQACHVEICVNTFTIHYKVVGSRVQVRSCS